MRRPTKCETIGPVADTDPRALLRSLFDAAVAAADPSAIVPKCLPAPPNGRTIVVGAGKAAAAMAAAVEAHWSGPLEGLVVTRVGHGAPTKRIRVVEAGHPNPDAAGVAAASEILSMVRGLTSDDLVLGLISGGGSALLSLPAGKRHARRQASDHPRSPEERRAHRRDQHRSQASLGDQGRPARGRRVRRRGS